MDQKTIIQTKRNINQTPLITHIINFIEQHQLLPAHATVVLGLSGGPDSVFLLHCLVHLKKNGRIKEVIAAHLDHGWRAESHKDVAFCKKLAASYGVSFVTAHLEDFKSTIRWNGSKEDVGRKARRLFLKKIMDEYHAHAIALAHHRDDQLETFFIRLIRGTSLTGLCAMRPHHGPFIRPLLTISKQQIVDDITAQAIPYVIDPSNSSTDYLRNRIRATVLPALHACDERFETKGLQTIERLQAAEDYIEQSTQELFAELSVKKDDTIVLQYNELLSQPLFMQYRLLMHWLIALQVPFPPTEHFLKEILRFLQAKKNKRHQIMDTWILEKEKGHLKLLSIT